MKPLVLYDSQFGNTKLVAEAVAGALGAAVVAVDEPLELDGIDLLVVGGPTQIHNVSDRLRQLLDALSLHALDGLDVAAFDTRFRRNPLLTGSAARGIARRLERRGGRMVAPPESFFVVDVDGPLEPDELDRATAWAAQLRSAVVPAPVA